MIKYLLILLILFMKLPSTGQIIDLPEQIDSIPRESYNLKFVDVLNAEYTKFMKNKNDSIVLFYIVPDYYLTGNYAIIFCKNKMRSLAFAFWQTDFPDGNVKKIEIKNDTLTSININYLYDIFQSNAIRTADTTILTSHENTILCQFYFQGTKSLKIGHISKVFNHLGDDFRRAFLHESLKNR